MKYISDRPESYEARNYLSLDQKPELAVVFDIVARDCEPDSYYMRYRVEEQTFQILDYQCDRIYRTGVGARIAAVAYPAIQPELLTGVESHILYLRGDNEYRDQEVIAIAECSAHDVRKYLGRFRMALTTFAQDYSVKLSITVNRITITHE